MSTGTQNRGCYTGWAGAPGPCRLARFSRKVIQLVEYGADSYGREDDDGEGQKYMSRNRVDMYKLIQSSCALVGNWGTTDRRVTIMYAFCVLIHMYFDASFVSSYVELHLC